MTSAVLNFELWTRSHTTNTEAHGAGCGNHRQSVYNLFKGKELPKQHNKVKKLQVVLYGRSIQLVSRGGDGMGQERLVHRRSVNIYGAMQGRKVKGRGVRPNHKDIRNNQKSRKEDHVIRFKFLEAYFSKRTVSSVREWKQIWRKTGWFTVHAVVPGRNEEDRNEKRKALDRGTLTRVRWGGSRGRDVTSNTAEHCYRSTTQKGVRSKATYTEARSQSAPHTALILFSGLWKSYKSFQICIFDRSFWQLGGRWV